MTTEPPSHRGNGTLRSGRVMVIPPVLHRRIRQCGAGTVRFLAAGDQERIRGPTTKVIAERGEVSASRDNSSTVRRREQVGSRGRVRPGDRQAACRRPWQAVRPLSTRIVVNEVLRPSAGVAAGNARSAPRIAGTDTGVSRAPEVRGGQGQVLAP